MSKLSLKDLAVKHDYYCSDSNYYSREAGETFTTFADFYNEWHDADIDMNLVFRWDISMNEDGLTATMEIFMIQQRKGIYFPVRISHVTGEHIESIIKFLTPHLDKLKSIWKPF